MVVQWVWQVVALVDMLMVDRLMQTIVSSIRSKLRHVPLVIVFVDRTSVE